MNMMGRMFAIWLIVGCGRFDFNHIAPDAPAPDAPPPASRDASRPQWSFVQTGAGASPLTISPSGAEHLIVVAVQVAAAGTVNSVTDDMGSTYVAVAAAQTSDPNDGLEIWYTPESRAKVTSIAIDTTVSVVAAVAWEVAGIDTDIALDTATELDAQPASTTPVGPIIATTVPGDFVVSVAIVANGITTTHTGNAFTNDHRTKGNGWAHLTDAAAPAGSYQAEWDQPTAGLYCANAAAFRVGDQ